jgi:Mg/Co/Ni transporter MgtE
LVADVTARLRDGWDICVVTNDANIVLGLLGRSALCSSHETRVESVMTPGPSTIRPSARLEAITKRMHDQNLTRIVVTRSDGVLFGVLRAEDIEPPSISR